MPGICLVCTMYMPTYTWYILGYTMYNDQVYTWYILGYTWYIIWCIYMVCTWYIVVYPWIFLAFWNQISRPASAACLIRRAHVCGWSRVFYSTRHHGNCSRGKGRPQKAQPGCRQPPPSVACCGGDGGGGGGAAGVYRFLLWVTTWILVKDGAEGAFRAGDQCVEQLRWLPVLKIEKKIISICKGGGSCSSDELRLRTAGIMESKGIHRVY